LTFIRFIVLLQNATRPLNWLVAKVEITITAFQTFTIKCDNPKFVQIYKIMWCQRLKLEFNLLAKCDGVKRNHKTATFVDNTLVPKVSQSCIISITFYLVMDIFKNDRFLTLFGKNKIILVDVLNLAFLFLSSSIILFYS